MYQKGAKNKEEGTDGKGGGNQLPREGGDPIQGHLTSAFLEAKHRSKQTQPLPLPRSVSTNQLRRRNIGGRRWGLQPAADIAFKVDAT